MLLSTVRLTCRAPPRAAPGCSACPGETHLLGACARFLHEDKGAEGLSVGVLAGLRFAGFDTDDVLTATIDILRAYVDSVAE